MYDNSNQEIAMEALLFSNIKSLRVYNGQKQCPLPRGERAGFGNAFFMIAPTKISGDESLFGGFIRYRSPFLYKHYLVDFYYREKIGKTRIINNNTGLYKKQFEKLKLAGVRQILHNNKKKKLEEHPNVLINLGNWHELFFKYRFTRSIKLMCTDYIHFLSQKINDPLFDDYDKTLYIDLNKWFDSPNKKIGFDKKSMNNPISILLLTIYKFPDVLKSLGKFTLIIANPSHGSFIKIDYNEMIPKRYNLIKSRLLSIEGVNNYINQETINAEEKIANEENPDNYVSNKIVPDKISKTLDTSNKNNSINNKEKQISSNRLTLDNDDAIVNDIVNKFNAERKLKAEKVRRQIIAGLKKNLVGDIDDITDSVSDEFDEFDKNEFPEIIESEEDLDNEIESVVNEYLDENPDILNGGNITDAIDKAQKAVKKKVYIVKFTPERTVEKLQKMGFLQKIHDEKVGSQSFEDLKSKIIDEKDVSPAVKTTNVNIVKSRFANFDKCYNEKKLMKDIHQSVGILSKANIKVYITDINEEDTSDQLTLKKTLTYKLKDENDNEMTVKFDIPIIIEDRYLYINGSEKEIRHQLILKPIVKTKADTVQLVTAYNKIFITRHGNNDYRTLALLKYLRKNEDEFHVKGGNSTLLNGDYITTMEFDMIAKYIYEFQIGDAVFITDISKLLSTLDKLGIKYDKIDTDKNLIVGYHKKNKTPIYIDKATESFTEKVMSYLPDNIRDELKKLTMKSWKSRYMYTKAKILEKNVPLIVLLLYFDGFKNVMEKANIEYKFINEDEAKEIDLYEWGLVELSDGYIAWKRYPIENSLLMNGLTNIPTDLYSYEELESKDTYIYMLSQFFNYTNMSFNLDQYKDFMIDDIAREILLDHGQPTELVELMIYANKLLTTNSYLPETHMTNMRLRSNEIISLCVYKAITDAYNVYRKSQHNRKIKKISVKQNEVIQRLYDSDLLEDVSTLNPILQLSKSYGVTYKGVRGIGMDKAMTLDKRAYNESMLGVLGITTSPDAGVGINRQLTLEPNITSTRGYIDVVGKENVDNLSGANLLTAAELLTPLGVQHDDPARTAMAYKQSMYMIPEEESDPVLIGNGVEKIIPYHMSSKFTVVAKDDGKVIEIKNGLMVIEYNDKTYQTINISKQIKRNAASGFYIPSQLITNKKVGDKVTKNEVVAWDDKAFEKNSNDLSASMRLGSLLKIAIIPEWDIYEDSAPISQNASRKMTTTMIMDREVTLSKNAHIYDMVKIGDWVNAGDPLIKFDNTHNDPDVVAFMNAMREKMSEEDADQIIESNSTVKKSKYSGTVVDIKIYSTVDLEELSPSLQKVVSEYYNRLKEQQSVLDKYSNPGDLKYYKSGQLITEFPEKVKPDYQGKIKGVKVDEGVLIIFFIEFKDRMGKGDKLASEFALKSITSHVIDEGLEPYSELHPDEPVDLIVAPLAISARKTPSIFLAMFGNKCLIEAFRHLKDFWFNN